MQLVDPCLLLLERKVRKKGKWSEKEKRGQKGVLVAFWLWFSYPFFFFFQYNRRAWSADEMAIPSILRDMGPNDIEAE